MKVVLAAIKRLIAAPMTSGVPTLYPSLQQLLIRDQQLRCIVG
jgi:hypothetical protein